MRPMLPIAAALLLTAAALPAGVGLDKKSLTEKSILFDPADFPIRSGPLADSEEAAKRKDAACRAKYDGKTVRAVGFLVRAKVDPAGKRSGYTLLAVYADVRDKDYPRPVQLEVDFATPAPVAALRQKPEAGLIVTVVGTAKIDAKGRLLIDSATVLDTNSPPG
jgi:hypothetical protein